MSKTSLSISTQNKLILLGLVVSTVLIVGLAVFAITNIQQKIAEVYSGFGEILTRTLAIESVEITKDVQEFDKFSTLQNHTKSIINSNNEIAFIEFQDDKNNVIYSSKKDYPHRAAQAMITSSSQLLVDNDGVKTNIGKVIVGLSGGATKDISHATRNSMLVVFTVAWLVFTLVILINTILITRELSMLHHGVKKISTGAFGYTLDDKNTSGEIKDLTAGVLVSHTGGMFSQTLYADNGIDVLYNVNHISSEQAIIEFSIPINDYIRKWKCITALYEYNLFTT